MRVADDDTGHSCRRGSVKVDELQRQGGAIETHRGHRESSAYPLARELLTADPITDPLHTQHVESLLLYWL